MREYQPTTHFGYGSRTPISMPLAPWEKQPEPPQEHQRPVMRLTDKEREREADKAKSDAIRRPVAPSQDPPDEEAYADLLRDLAKKEGHLAVLPKSPQDKAGGQRPSRTQAIAVEMLSRGPVTVAGLARRARVPKHCAHSVLYHMVRTGKVRSFRPSRREHTIYRLAAE